LRGGSAFASPLNTDERYFLFTSTLRSLMLVEQTNLNTIFFVIPVAQAAGNKNQRRLFYGKN